MLQELRTIVQNQLRASATFVIVDAKFLILIFKLWKSGVFFYINVRIPFWETFRQDQLIDVSAYDWEKQKLKVKGNF